jgi:hypothetical protein
MSIIIFMPHWHKEMAKSRICKCVRKIPVALLGMEPRPLAPLRHSICLRK